MELTVGEVLEGKVTGIAKFGAFVALDGGRSGLVHISEVANTYVQASTFPRVMIVGMLIFSVVLLIQSIFKLMGTMKPTDPVAVEVGTLNPLKDKGVAAAYLVMLLCVLFAALFKSCGYILCAVVLSMIIMFLIGKRNWVQMVLVSVLVPLLMWLVFYKVLTVNIPLGPLNFLRTLVDMI